MGYPVGFKGYKVLDLDTNTTSVSRHVVFHEDIFPSVIKDSDLQHDLYSETDDVNKTHTDSTDVPVVVSGDTPTVVNKDIVVDNQVPIISESSSIRPLKQPAYLEDYYCNMTATDIPYPLAAHLSYEKLTKGYRDYVCAVTKHVEPTSFNQAKKFDKWIKAMNEELIALESNDTWSVCSLPPGKHAIGCRWVYKVKLNADGTLESYKVRLVAKGYTQQEGIDFVDTFSPVAKMNTVKTLIAVSAAKKWSLTQLDISNAFLNGDLDEEIYMSLPPGYTLREGTVLPPNPVCRLNKSLYGLKQASRQWFLKFSSTLTSLGFQTSHSDHTLFIRNINGIYMAVLVYVDDIVIASNNDEVVDQLKNALKQSFKLRDLGPLRYFLGLEIARASHGISICQRKYILELLDETWLLACKPSTIPMDPSIKLRADSKEPLLSDPGLYRRLVGKMMYLTITRPDITFAVNKLCQFSYAPTATRLKAAYKVLHYLKGTVGKGLFYSATSDLVLKVFTDADWGSCADTRRSTSGYCMFLGSYLISWKSKKQNTVSHSSAESEYRAMEFAVRETVWVVNLLKEFTAPQHQPVAFFCDSTTAIHIANNKVFHERTKCLEIDCHIVREKVLKGLIKSLHVRSDNQSADVFTKPLYPALFHSLLSKMSFSSICMPS